MLKARQMSRLLIAASKDRMEPIIQELYRHNVFHIEDFVDQAKKEYEGFRIGMPLPGAGEISTELLTIRSLEATYLVNPDNVEPGNLKRSSDIRALIERDLPIIEKETDQLTGLRSQLDTEEKYLEQKITGLEPFTGIPVPLDLLRGYSSLAVFTGYVARDVVPDIPHERFYVPSKEGNFLVLIVPAGHRQAVERLLSDAMFQQVPVPEESGQAAASITLYKEKIVGIKRQMQDVAAKIGENRKKHTDFLVACDELLTSDVQKAEAPLRFATTDQAFIAEGWVPVTEVAGLTEAIDKLTGGKSFVTELPFNPDRDTIPVEYDNPKFADPTQLIIDIYARPKYWEIDPTVIVAFIFPLFFGLILGDVGYGLMLLGVSLVLRRYFKRGDGAQLVNILMIFAISSIIFGILYSEFLGFKLPWEPLIFSRHMNIGGEGGAGAAIPELLVTSVWIGVLYITLGRILGIINHARHDHGSHREKAVLANFGWILFMWGILIALWAYFPIPLMINLTTLSPVVAGLTPGVIAGILMIIIGAVFIARENALDVFELPTIISHTLSFTRLVAVGLSSVAIAMVVNFISIGMIIAPQLQHLSVVGIVIIFVGVMVFIVGHIGNAALGLIGGALQSLRLQYVEFFTKFYKGGGKKYNPFGMKKRFTEE
ncbi:MAG TPA: V-type ATP synthase subunit I [Methanoregulaceae archaeon]|nr:V-type ATP synthase subunit I [Methanoregulaceae archaeon]